jgi:hypothetical protein
VASDELLPEGQQDSGYLVLFPIDAADLQAAIGVAELLVRSLPGVPGLRSTDVTVSSVDRPDVQHAVWCDVLLLGSVRCGLRAGHDGDHRALVLKEASAGDESQELVP